jgi:hypothetical protein
MAILDIFSKRNKPLPDVYQYRDLPQGLRVQVVHILQDVMGPNFGGGYGAIGWAGIAKLVAKEHGLLRLPKRSESRFDETTAYEDCLNYVLQSETPEALDMIEVCFRVMGVAQGRPEYMMSGDASAAAQELNARFRQHGCGFQFEAGNIMRVDSTLLHADVVLPAIKLLSAKGFEGPNKEFLSAHEHFRHGRIEEAITDACKAFESTIKAICDAQKWKYDPKGAAASLIKTITDNGLVPTYSEEQLQNVAKCLIGVATVRNKTAGHGAGSKPREVAEHYAAYALHLAASNIVFLVECHKAKK